MYCALGKDDLEKFADVEWIQEVWESHYASLKSGIRKKSDGNTLIWKLVSQHRDVRCMRHVGKKSQDLCDTETDLSRKFGEYYRKDPFTMLRDCDGKKCVYSRVTYPDRRGKIDHIIAEELKNAAKKHFESISMNEDGTELHITSFGSGLLLTEFAAFYQFAKEITAVLDRPNLHNTSICINLIDSIYSEIIRRYSEKSASWKMEITSCSNWEKVMFSEIINPSQVFGGRNIEFGSNCLSEFRESTVNEILGLSFLLQVNESIYIFSHCIHTILRAVGFQNVRVHLFDNLERFSEKVLEDPAKFLSHAFFSIDIAIKNISLLRKYSNTLIDNSRMLLFTKKGKVFICEIKSDGTLKRIKSSLVE